MSGASLHPQQKFGFFHTVERRETGVGRHVNAKLGIFLSKCLLYGEVDCGKGKIGGGLGCRRAPRRQGEKDARVSEEEAEWNCV